MSEQEYHDAIAEALRAVRAAWRGHYEPDGDSFEDDLDRRARKHEREAERLAAATPQQPPTTDDCVSGTLFARFTDEFAICTEQLRLERERANAAEAKLKALVEDIRAMKESWGYYRLRQDARQRLKAMLDRHAPKEEGQ